MAQLLWWKDSLWYSPLKAHEVGMEKYNKMAKLGIIRKTGSTLAKAIFFCKGYYHYLPDSDFCI